MTDTAERNTDGPKILIADDDPAIVRLIADRCVKMGFNVQTATNGIHLLIKARQSQPEIIIVDVNMPGLDGLTVCTRLLEANNSTVEVIVITGGTDQETVDRCVSMGLHYARKGPDFWKRIESALIAFYPAMAGKFTEPKPRSVDTTVRDRPRVLLVDDDPEAQRFFASRLEKCGVEMLQASGAIEGHKIARREKPSVIICDYFMPNGDAHYLLYKLRTTPGTENIPVLVISGSPLDDVSKQRLMREICGHPGASQIFHKSFDTNELFSAIQHFCAFKANYAHA